MNKPWLTSYDSDVPATLAYPRMLIHQLFEKSAVRFPGNIALNFFGTSMTYHELQESVTRFAGALHPASPATQVMP